MYDLRLIFPNAHALAYRVTAKQYMHFKYMFVAVFLFGGCTSTLMRPTNNLLVLLNLFGPTWPTQLLESHINNQQFYDGACFTINIVI